MIKFEKIKIKNFLSFGNNFTEIDLDKNKTTMIQGKNGRGKSSVFDAIHFVLFNKPFRDIPKPSCINSINGSNLLIELELSKGSKKYKIVRGMKPNKFEIFEDGNLLDQDAASKDYQEYLEANILDGLNEKVFKQVVMIGAGSHVPFMQLSTPQRREVIEELLDIKIFSNINNLVKEKLSWYKDILKDLDRDIQIIEQKIILNKENQKKLKDDNSSKIVEIENKIEDRKKFLKISSENLEKLKKEKSEINFDQKQIDELQKSKSKYESTLAQFKMKQRENSETIKFFEDNCNCSTCQQKITEEHKIAILTPLKEKIPKFQEAILKLENNILDASENLKNGTKILNKIRDLDTEILKETSNLRNHGEIIKDYEKTIEKLKNSEILTDNANEIEKAEEELVLAKNRKQNENEEKKYYDAISILLKDGGIKSKIIKQYIPVINKIINDYLVRFNLPIQFMLDENFNETIKSRYRDTFKYDNFSAGEKQRIDTAILLAWREIARSKNTTNCNILMIDEGLDTHLDNDGIEVVLDILSESSNSNIFIISHKGEEYFERFERILEVEKSGNFSQIVEKYS